MCANYSCTKTIPNQTTKTTPLPMDSRCKFNKGASEQSGTMFDGYEEQRDDMASCFEAAFFRRVGLFQAPLLTTAHKIIGTAAVLGFLFSILHVVTIIVTVSSAGADWGLPAWMLDLTGFLAGTAFAFLCREASNKPSSEKKQDSVWILIWSAITFCIRILDILMLTGLVKIEAIYHTPSGPTLYANIVSEIVIAFPYTTLALVGSVLLVCFPKDLAVHHGQLA